MPRSYKLTLLGLVLIGMAIFVGVQHTATAIVKCDATLSQEMLEESLALGADFIVANQKSAGNFEYEYDWLAKTYNPDDNAVRQAGALWGLTLIYEYTSDPKLIEPLERSFAFFENHSQIRKDGARYILYPGESGGGLGTVALVALAHIEYLNAREDELANEELARHESLLEGYLRLISTAITEERLFAGSYDEQGAPNGWPSPYSDGESLLALVKAARYRGYSQWEKQIKELADAGYEINVREALAEDPDSDTTKGYYQWSSMAYRELAESGWKDTDKYGDYAIELADWMIDTHRVLKRTRNTGYAFEGILSAYAVAKERDDEAHAEKFRCVTEDGLSKLTSWQIGSDIANTFITTQFKGDARALGGVQNHTLEAPLRIDVTQHQMHAVIFALEELFDKR